MSQYTQTALALILSTPLLLSGCSSDSGGSSGNVTYKGNISAAVISAENAEEISVAVTEGTTQAVSEDTANESNPFAFSVTSVSTPGKDINTTIARIINSTRAQTNNLATAATVGAAEFGSDPYYCGGSVIIPDNFETSSGKITFKNFCYDFLGQMTMNGSIKFSQTASALTISYTNFTVSFEGEAYTINSSINCGLDGSGFITTCTISSSFKGTDGLTYRIDNFTVSGDPTFGFNVDATFYHPTHGSVTVTTTSPILLNCTGPQPSSGSISYTGSGGTSGSITFDSCTAYTYCYDTGVIADCSTGMW